MLPHALLTLYRSLTRHRLYAALNVFGLAFGIAVFLVLTLVVQYEREFNHWLPNADHVYRIDSTFLLPGEQPNENSNVTYAVMDLLRADYPQIQAGVREMRQPQPVSVGSTIDSEEVSHVDPSFLNVVELPMLAGHRADALAQPGNVVVTASIARKYFGTTQVIGKTLEISDRGVKQSFMVSAVLRDLPADTTLRFDLLVPMTQAFENEMPNFKDWGTSMGPTYLRFASMADAQAVGRSLRSFVARRAAGSADAQMGSHPQDRLRLSLVPLSDAHFHDATVDADLPGVDRRVIYSLGVVGLLALVTAAINYVNLATARSGLRAREVALRKVMGATRRMLLVQFLGEAVALVALSAMIGLALTELAVPMVNALGGWAVRIDYLEVVPLLVMLVAVVGLVAGFYPALMLAAYRPAAVLAAARTPAGGRMGTQVRNLLVLTQFASAIAFAICTLVINAQAKFLRDADRGFDRQGLILVQSLAADELLSRQNVILDTLRHVPGVIAATASDREPDSTSTSGTTVLPPGHVGVNPHLIYETVGRGYFTTYGVRLVAGRFFDDAHRMDDRAGVESGLHDGSTIINQSALPVLGFRDPAAAIGRNFSLNGRQHKAVLTIVGVVQDVRFMSPREAVRGQFYTYDTAGFKNAEAAIRFKGVPRAEMMQRLGAAWQTVAPDNPFMAKTADERLADYYQPDQQRARLFSVGAVLAVAIACVGLYGLASFNTARRVKEIGIRKVLGASTRDVLLLLVGQFVRPVLLANLIAWPIAWAVMRGWLAGFDQRIGLSPLYFAAVTIAALAISVLTVAGQVWRVARSEPARALRYE